MRASRFARLLGGVVLLACGATAVEARYEGSLNLFAGRKWLKSGDWAPADTQDQLGLMFAFGEERAAVHFSIDALFGNGDVGGPPPAFGELTSSSSTEVAIGVRKVWTGSATHPHLGAGANVIDVSEERRGPSGPLKVSDRGYGVWVDAGVTWRLAKHLNLGLEARFSSARAELGSGFAPRDVAAGGVHFGLLIGYGW
jgi:hypothetical protein